MWKKQPTNAIQVPHWASVYVLAFIVLMHLCACEKAAPKTKPPSEPTPEVAEKSGNLQTVTTRQGKQEKKTTIKTEPIQDGCSMEVAQKVLKKSHPAIKECGQAYAQRTKKRPVGKMIFALVLKADGWPRQVATTTDEIGDQAFKECIKKALKLRFPNPFGKECIIQAPFTFTAKQKVTR